MKKALVIFILLMLVVPAMATISVTATCTGTAPNYTVTVAYSASATSEVPRAFGLLISCDANGTIGTVTANKASYYVAPGTFNYNGTAVTTWGNPIVPVTAGKSFILEVGSLYASNDPCTTHRLQPALSGTLLTFPLAVPTGTSTVSIAADAARGGVVREDPSVTSPSPTLTGCKTIPQSICFPSTSNYATQYKQFQSYKQYVTTWDGACWCGHVSTKWKYQCEGDANGDVQSGYRVYTNDLGVLSANWQKKITDPTINPCADINHKADVQGYRVYSNDLARLSANWTKKNSDLTGTCPKTDALNTNP